jgi:hypothetical protein
MPSPDTADATTPSEHAGEPGATPSFEDLGIDKRVLRGLADVG